MKPSFVNIATLKAELAKYLRLVKNGTSVTITEHRHPIAKLVPINEELTPTESSLSFAAAVKGLRRIPGLKNLGDEALELLREDRNKR
jgi:prevent-host-death family protein